MPARNMPSPKRANAHFSGNTSTAWLRCPDAVTIVARKRRRATRAAAVEEKRRLDGGTREADAQLDEEKLQGTGRSGLLHFSQSP